MAWQVLDSGSWKLAITDSATDLAGALALPGSWPVGQQLECFVRNDQVGNLASGPPVAGYSAWWDASAITGVADGAGLASWPDGSTNHKDLAQASGGLQPVYYKTTSAKLVNGKPAVWFNGGQVMATGSAFALSPPYTFVAVLKVVSTGANAWLFDTTGGVPYLQRQNSGNQWNWVGQVQWQTATSPTGNVQFLAGTATAADSKLYQDAATVDGTGFGQVAYAGTLYVGAANASATGPWSGPVCELAIYPSVLSAGQIASWRSYAQSKWGTP